MLAGLLGNISAGPIINIFGVIVFGFDLTKCSTVSSVPRYYRIGIDGYIRGWPEFQYDGEHCLVNGDRSIERSVGLADNKIKVIMAPLCLLLCGGGDQ